MSGCVCFVYAFKSWIRWWCGGGGGGGGEVTPENVKSKLKENKLRPVPVLWVCLCCSRSAQSCSALGQTFALGSVGLYEVFRSFTTVILIGQAHC